MHCGNKKDVLRAGHVLLCIWAQHKSCLILGEKRFLGMVAHSPACIFSALVKRPPLLLCARLSPLGPMCGEHGLELTGNERIN